jgi:DNA-binding transcriptional LysR family regulator
MIFDDVTVGEIGLLAELPHHSSLRALARARGVDPVKLTRVVQGLEAKLGVKLLQRSNLGIRLTQDGTRLAERARGLLGDLRDFEKARSSDPVQSYEQNLTVGSRGFLNIHLAAVVLQAINGRGGGRERGLTFVDLSPDETAEAARQGFLDLCIGFEASPLGASWEFLPIGQLSWGIFGRARHPLATGATRADLLRYRIANHCFWNGSHIVVVDGLLKDRYGVRQLGHGTQTAQAALEVASASDQLACVPTIVARDLVEAGKIVAIDVEATEPIRTEVYLGVRTDRISRSDRDALVVALGKKLA